MSIKAMTWAFSQPLSGNEKVVLLALADAADDTGVCWPSVPALAEKAYVSERTVQRVVQTLIEGGYLSTVSRSYENGRSAANKYLLKMAEGDSLTPYESRPVGEGDSLTEGDNGVTHEGDNCVTPLKRTQTVTVTSKHIRRARVKIDLPEDWQPDARTWALADDLGFTAQEAWDQLERMRDWAKNADGGKGRKSDWDAAFRNWLKRAADDRRNRPQAPRQRNALADSFAILDAVTDEAIRRTDGRGAQGREEDPFELPGLRQSAA